MPFHRNPFNPGSKEYRNAYEQQIPADLLYRHNNATWNPSRRQLALDIAQTNAMSKEAIAGMVLSNNAELVATLPEKMKMTAAALREAKKDLEKGALADNDTRLHTIDRWLDLLENPPRRLDQEEKDELKQKGDLSNHGYDLSEHERTFLWEDGGGFLRINSEAVLNAAAQLDNLENPDKSIPVLHPSVANAARALERLAAADPGTMAIFMDRKRRAPQLPPEYAKLMQECQQSVRNIAGGAFMILGALAVKSKSPMFSAAYLGLGAALLFPSLTTPQLHKLATELKFIRTPQWDSFIAKHGDKAKSLNLFAELQDRSSDIKGWENVEDGKLMEFLKTNGEPDPKAKPELPPPPPGVPKPPAKKSTMGGVMGFLEKLDKPTLRWVLKQATPMSEDGAKLADEFLLHRVTSDSVKQLQPTGVDDKPTFDTTPPAPSA